MKRYRSTISWLASGAVAALLALAVPAEAGARPCADEVKKICGDVEPGSGELRECIRANESSFSAECRERMQKMRERHARMAAACGADIEKLCGGIEPGDRKIARCLRDHADELSPGCREGFRHHARRRSAPEPSGGGGAEK